ncbi:apolipoprotein F [Anolis carolinensis]|uniref:Apolipoprotein F n=1 Tax=Anolis carolinensis TaxID=28377 RepID=A0A803TSG7_ANOCA
MYSPLPMTFLAFFGFLLHPESEGHLMSPRENDAETHPLTSGSIKGPLHVFFRSMSSKSLQFQLQKKGVSCQDLMPEAMGNFANVPWKSQTLIRASLALALQAAGCNWHAEILVHRLYKDLGQEDTDALLFAMADALGTANHAEKSSSSTAALQFNLDQLAPTKSRRCRGLMQVNDALLHGQGHSIHRGFLAAAVACHHLGDSCAGVSVNGTSSFQVVERNGSYHLPHPGAKSWLHQCHRLARVQRSTPDDCASEREQRVHAVMEWLPGVSTFYNFGTSIYYATQDCTDLAKDRALDGAIDLGYDTLVAMTGGAGGGIAFGVSAALKPGMKAGVRYLIDYFNQQKEEAYTVPTNYTGPVIIM